MSIQHTTLVNDCAEFLRRYYHDEIAELALAYPKDSRSLWIDYNDLSKYSVDLADDLITHPDEILSSLEDAITHVDVPVDIDLSEAHVRVRNFGESNRVDPGEIRSKHANQFVSVVGTLERVTTTDDMPVELPFECLRCGVENVIEQDPTSGALQEPHDCVACERSGPFQPKTKNGTWVDHAKIRIESRAGTNPDSTGKITGVLIDDIIEHGGPNGILGRAGEAVIVNGVLERVQKDGRGENEMLFDHVLKVNSVEFENDDNTVRIEDHKDEFERLASQPDAIDKFAQSIAPNLHTTSEWDAAMEFAVAYLFGAPRIDIPNGPQYRGDLHFLIISDYGMGKSDFSTDIEAYSPQCISKSTTALSSGVGLTAAAVEDDFGEGAWTIKPGLLVRANGGHLILDEIDKGPDELTEMNDAIEGKQEVDVEKAGKSVTYDSKTAILALGNPIEGRFDQNQPISSQLGIDESLLSRFDAIVTMEDNPDKEQDKRIAETYGRAYTEAQQAEFGGREDFTQLEREVPVDVGQAWIKYARENVNPILTYEQYQTLEDWYADEVRQLNNRFADSGESEDMPVPATVRVISSAVKMSIAFARVRLQDEVKEPQIERAMKLGKKLIKQHWDGEQFDVTKNRKPTTQSQQIKAIEKATRSESKSVEEIAQATNIDAETVEKRIEKRMRKGEMTEPVTGEYKSV